LLQQARPRFAGHRQPIVPAWGYFDEADPHWAARQIDLAADHGVTCFLFDWYWYDGAQFLNASLDDGHLEAANVDRMSFALMWANHDWYDLQPVSYRGDPDKLFSGRVSEQDFESITTLWVERYFSHPSYLLFDGAPYLSIYDLASFIDSFGGVTNARAALDRLSHKARQAGFPGIHLNVIAWSLNLLPGELAVTDPSTLVESLGVASMGSYTWWHDYGPTSFPTCPYDEAADSAYQIWEKHRTAFSVPHHPNISMGWDSSPRPVQSDRYEPRPGYGFLPVCEGNTPAAFRTACERALAFVADAPEVQMVTVNAWNEWTEGSYLLPDTVHGNAYLEAIRDVFGAA